MNDKRMTKQIRSEDRGSPATCLSSGTLNRVSDPIYNNSYALPQWVAWL